MREGKEEGSRQNELFSGEYTCASNNPLNLCFINTFRLTAIKLRCVNVEKSLYKWIIISFQLDCRIATQTQKHMRYFLNDVYCDVRVK